MKIKYLFVHVLGDCSLSLNSHFVLQDMFSISVGEGHEPGRDNGDNGQDDGRGRGVDSVDPPVQPNGNGRDDKCIAIK